MPDRRAVLLAAAGSLLLPGFAYARIPATAGIGWQDFLDRISGLAGSRLDDGLPDQVVGETGLRLMQQLDTGSADFGHAIEDAWESGNRFWLWQRLARTQTLLGGVLQIDKDNDVPLHDHPGATGMLRVLSGSVEVWQFDRIDAHHGTRDNACLLKRTEHRILHPGDTAMLLPEHGNIHALRANSAQCSMLDFFIPPYQRKLRSWYQPLEHDRTEIGQITCRRIAENDFHMS